MDIQKDIDVKYNEIEAAKVAFEIDEFLGNEGSEKLESLIALSIQYGQLCAERDSIKPETLLSLSKDGNQWVVLYGADLQSGKAGFGDTPEDALSKFAVDWLKIGDAIGLIIQDVAELPDRTSPEDQPSMMLVSDSELKSILGHHLGFDTFELAPPSPPTLKAYEMDDEYTVYAAGDAQAATAAYLADMGDDYQLEDGYPIELTDSELDAEYPDTDENEVPNGKTFTIRQMLAEKKEDGFLCGGAS